jgi:hypothetical protein
MINRFPVFLMLFVALVGSTFLGLNAFFSRGGVLDLTILAPYYMPWLQKSGITHASLFLEWEKDALWQRHWVLGATKVDFAGGRAESVRLRLDWIKGTVKLQRLDIDHLTIDLKEIIQSPRSESSVLPGLISTFLTTPGSIARLMIRGGDGFFGLNPAGPPGNHLANGSIPGHRIDVKNRSLTQQSPSIFHDVKGNQDVKNLRDATHPSSPSKEGSVNTPQYGGLIIPSMDISWENGIIVIWPAESTDQMPANLLPKSKKIPRQIPPSIINDLSEKLGHHLKKNVPKAKTLPKTVSKKPIFSNFTQPSKSLASIESLRLSSFKNTDAAGQNSDQSWAVIRLNQTEQEGEVEAFWNPIALDLSRWGISQVLLRGKAYGNWTLNKGAIEHWSIQMDVNQFGSAEISETLGQPMQSHNFTEPQKTLHPKKNLQYKGHNQPTKCLVSKPAESLIPVSAPTKSKARMAENPTAARSLAPPKTQFLTSTARQTGVKSSVPVAMPTGTNEWPKSDPTILGNPSFARTEGFTIALAPKPGPWDQKNFSTNHSERQSKNFSGLTLGKSHIYARFSNNGALALQVQTVLDRAQLSGSLSINPESQQHLWVGKLKLDRGVIALSKLWYLWPKIPKFLSPRTWIVNNFHGGMVSQASVVAKGSIPRRCILGTSSADSDIGSFGPSTFNPMASSPHIPSPSNPSKNTEIPKNHSPSASQSVLRIPTNRLISKRSMDSRAQPIPISTSIQGAVDITDMGLSFVSSMPRIEKMNIRTTFDAKGFKIKIAKGLFENHAIVGNVNIAMEGNPAVLELDVNLSGPIKNLLPILLRFSDAPDIGIRHPTGMNQTRVQGSLPLLSTLSQKDICLNLHSTMPVAGFDFSIGTHLAKIRNTHITMDHQSDRLTIQAKGKVDDIPTTWSWKDNALDFLASPNLKKIQDMLHFNFDPYVKNNPILRGRYSQSKLVLDIDFKPCACIIPWINWKKPPGSELCLTFTKTDNGGDVLVKGRDISGKAKAEYLEKIPKVTGEVRIGANFGQYAFTGTKSASGWSDLWHLLLSSGHHQIFFRAPKIELPSLLPMDASLRKSGDTPGKDIQLTKPHQASTRIDLDLACDQVQMKSILMDQVHLKLSGIAPSIWPISGKFLTQYAWHKGSFYSVHRARKAKRKKLGHVSVLWDALEPSKTQVIADVVNIGSVCNGLGLTERIYGGDLRLNAIQDAFGVYAGDIHIDGIKTKLSALGKLLSMISPAMVTEMFSSGVTFEQLDADFTYGKGILKIINGIGKGINLGLFIKGSIRTDPGQFKLKGVAVPSYFFNTFFSKFPLIGWILGGNKGLISSEFTVTGPLKNPKITVIPLSFLKIGFLKNIPFFKEAKKARKRTSRSLDQAAPEGAPMESKPLDTDDAKNSATKQPTKNEPNKNIGTFRKGL